VTATPIGNLKDITLRAMEVLGSVQLVAAEDTRRTRTLLNSLGISVPCISCREHNEQRAALKITEKLLEGHDVAFVTDAGTPGISDPGGRLVSTVRQAGIDVLPVPGPSAAVAVMSISGFSASSFHFAGFLPNRTRARKKMLEKLAHLDVPIIFFESPHRIISTLKEMHELLGDRKIFMGREISKVYEEHFTGTVSELLHKLSGEDIRGEIALVTEGAKEAEARAETLTEEYPVRSLVTAMLEKGCLSARDITDIVSEATGIKRNRIYHMVNSIKDSKESTEGQR
jgi:16S rRNA (cytidine1402-2'-O)-methyltransferase